MRPPPWLVVVLVGAGLGLTFAGLSTYDFVQHLDRQVHSLHCSFVPGLGAEGGGSGCQAAMMSPYSSVFRTRVWGGVPISLPAMAVFAFVGFFALDLLLTRRKDDPRATAFLALACALPALTSCVMAIISLTQLGTACKLCVGIYAASALCLTGAITTWRRAVRDHAAGPAPARPPARTGPRGDEPAFVGRAAHAPTALAATLPAMPEPAASAPPVEARVAMPTVSHRVLAGAFGLGVVFVGVPVALYLAMAPDHARFVGTCDGLIQPEDTYGVMVRVDAAGGGGVPALEILDPLCPACRAFEERLVGSGFAARLDRKAILFPLDSSCNWMVTEATHPGACTVSEAVLCAGERAPEVLAWAFETQDQIRTQTKADPDAAGRLVRARFPELASCVGSPEAKSRLNKSMRWAVANNIQILTPQLFVGNVKLCDEDVDLGLEYTLSVMLERHARGALTASPTPGGAAPPAAAAEPPPPAPGAPAAPAGPAPAAPSAPAAAAPAAPAAPAGPSPTTTGQGAATAPPSSTPPAGPATSPPAGEPASEGPVTAPDVEATPTAPDNTAPAAPAPAPSAPPPAPTPGEDTPGGTP